MKIALRRSPLALAAFLSLLATPAMGAPGDDAPPKAPVREVTDTYFGTAVVDPYRWMEDLKSEETLDWMKAQADFARRRLDALPARGDLLKRLVALSNSNVSVFGVQAAVSGAAGAPLRLFYNKLAPGENSPKLFVRDGLEGAERLLVDPEKIGDKGTHYSVESFSPSLDGKFVSYTVSPGGSEMGELRVIEVETGKDTGERIDRARFDSGSWLPDGRSFLYNRLQQLPPGAPQTDLYQKSRVFLHVQGTPADKDRAVFGFDLNPDIRFEPALLPFASVAVGTPYAVATVNSGVSPNSAFFVAPIASLGETPVPWRKVVDLSDEVSSVAVHGDDLYALTYKGTPRYRVVRTSVAKPDLAKAQPVFPAGEAVVTGMAPAADALYVQTLDGGLGRLWRAAWDGGPPKPIPLPLDGTLFLSVADPRLAGVWFGMASWTKSSTLYAFDPAQGTVKDTKLQPPSPLDFSAIESVEVKVKSHDGTMVPLSIIARRGLKHDGGNPTFLSGYGAYGISIEPFFSGRSLAWLERGGVIAMAHVRGGGEYGEEWHLAGCKATKPNTWKDFIACAEFLVREGYTAPAHLAGEGTSAGGILIGNAIADRPDLFGAAVINVGACNTLRSETSSNGVPNIPEFGTFTTEDGFRGLLAMDSYQKIRDRTAYPAVLVTTGINDPRVPPWMAAKMAARLQAGTTSGKPVLLRVDYDAGHGMGSTRQQRIEQEADMYAFLLQQIGGR